MTYEIDGNGDYDLKPHYLRRLGLFLGGVLLALIKFAASAALIGGAIVVGALVGGFVLQHLWNWFLPHIGLPIISLGVAIGIDVVVTFFLMGLKKDDTYASEVWKRTGYFTASTAFLFLFGYIVHLVVG